ncbi:MAG: ABC transporter permease [Clostridium sp.]|nr:ABC transporter permease [Clostridium sp.]
MHINEKEKKMKSELKKRVFNIVCTVVSTVLLSMLFIHYYNVQENKVGIFVNIKLYMFFMIALSLFLGWMLSVSACEFKQVVKFLNITFKNTTLIKTLSKNDFKNKFASSYLGIVWGFIHPLVTIIVYWFVFQVAFKQESIGNIPYIIWFICGIIPWFFFSESFPSTSNVFLEYSYLVKKVVFKIEVLPAVKIIAALFVHAFFILFIYLITSLYGIKPDLYTIQFVYYSGAMIIFVYAVSIFTSSVILFFRDLGQIISVILSVGFWFTPIGWRLTAVPEWARIVFKLNPLYYIVVGYRDAFVDKIFFWQRPYLTLYFWLVCFTILCLGVKMFNKLKPHFSDVI